jgi:hypothetical protein
MEYVMSCYDALTFHHDLPFITHHYFTELKSFTFVSIKYAHHIEKSFN